MSICLPFSWFIDLVYHLGAICFSLTNLFFNVRRIAPTILLGVPQNSLIMKEEIFGPLLPILTVSIKRSSAYSCIIVRAVYEAGHKTESKTASTTLKEELLFTLA